jgi:two-component system chemotaxis response regulator CheY
MGKTVLIVDDSDLVRRILGFTLKKEGFNTLFAEDGKEALSHLDGRDISLIVSDLNMPVMGGLEMIKEVREMENYRFMPVVLFVSDAGADLNHYIRTSGATIVFDKDAIKEKLASTVKKLIW